MKDYSGKRYNNMTVIKSVYEKEYKNGKCVFVECVCDCGNKKTVRISDLQSGRTTSCGCNKIKKSKQRNTKHSMCDSRIYRIWSGMKARCKYKSCEEYRNYGGRGVSVCEEWLNSFVSFYNWSMSNGYKENLSIDRINVNGNYCPENCRWATTEEQSNNKRVNKFFNIDGENKTLMQICKEKGLNYRMVQSRIRYGWDKEHLFVGKLKKWKRLKRRNYEAVVGSFCL